MAKSNPELRPYRLKHGKLHTVEDGEAKIVRRNGKVLLSRAQAAAYSDMVEPWADTAVEAEVDTSAEDDDGGE